MKAAQFWLLMILGLSNAEAQLQKPTSPIAIQTFLRAAEQGQLAAMKKNSAVGVDVVNKAGETALMRASNAGQAAVVQWLLEQKANPNIKDKSGFTAIYYAVTAGHDELVSVLVKSGADLSYLYGEQKENLIFAAAELGQVRTIQTLCIKNANLARELNTEGEHALFKAIRSFQSKAAVALIKCGSAITIKNKKGETPLTVAQAEKYPADSTLLKELGAKDASKESTKESKK